MKLTLREEVGSAINSSDLSGRDTTMLNALAMGADQLGALLWRVKYGGDQRPTTMRELKDLLVPMVHGNRTRAPGPHVVSLVEAALREWLDDSCPECRGRRFVGTEYGDVRDARERCPAGCRRGPSGTYRVAGVFETAGERAMNAVSCQRCGGRGWIPGREVDASRTTVCRTCNGTSRLLFGPGERAAAMGVTREEFERRWASKYERALSIMRARDSKAGRTVAKAMHCLDGAPGMPD